MPLRLLRSTIAAVPAALSVLAIALALPSGGHDARAQAQRDSPGNGYACAGEVNLPCATCDSTSNSYYCRRVMPGGYGWGRCDPLPGFNCQSQPLSCKSKYDCHTNQPLSGNECDNSGTICK